MRITGCVPNGHWAELVQKQRERISRVIPPTFTRLFVTAARTGRSFCRQLLDAFANVSAVFANGLLIGPIRLIGESPIRVEFECSPLREQRED